MHFSTSDDLCLGGGDLRFSGSWDGEGRREGGEVERGFVKGRAILVHFLTF